MLSSPRDSSTLRCTCPSLNPLDNSNPQHKFRSLPELLSLRDSRYRRHTCLSLNPRDNSILEDMFRTPLMLSSPRGNMFLLSMLCSPPLSRRHNRMMSCSQDNSSLRGNCIPARRRQMHLSWPSTFRRYSRNTCHSR